jgi:tetratricopeptide (TPR) repeat protein
MRAIGGIITTTALAWLTACATGPRIRLPDTYQALLSRAVVDSTDPIAHYRAALAHWSKQHWADVERELAHAIAIDPQYAEAYLALAFLPHARLKELTKEEERTGNPTIVSNAMTRGEQMYRRALLIDPFVDHQIVSAVGLEPVNPVAITIGRGVIIFGVSPYGGALDHFYHGRYDQAFERLSEIQKSLEHQPHRIDDGVFWFRALAAAQIGKYTEGLRDLTILLERATRREESAASGSSFLQANEYRYVLGCLEFRAGRLSYAEALLQEAVRLDPSLYVAHVRLGDLDEHHRRWLDALVHRRAAMDLSPDNSSLERDLARTLLRSQRGDEAVEVLSRAASRSPVHPLVWYELGITLDGLGRADEARRAYDHFLAIVPPRFQEHRADAEARRARLDEPRDVR